MGPVPSSTLVVEVGVPVLDVGVCETVMTSNDAEDIVSDDDGKTG